MAQNATLISDRFKAANAADDLSLPGTSPQPRGRQALLGAILVNNEAMDRVSDFWMQEHFFDPLHQQI